MYTHNWSAATPGCLIFLLDQSASMEEPFGPSQVGSGQEKCEVVCTAFNSVLDELITVNMVIGPNHQGDVRPRADIAVLGYHGDTVTSALAGSLAAQDFVSLPDLQKNPVRVEERTKQELDGSGHITEIAVPFPVWVEPVATGGTPMLQALQRAHDLAEGWASAHPESYPPIILNLTDGVATDSHVAGDLEAIAHEISQICTNDGNSLLFTVHITGLKAYPVDYPATEDELPNDPFARRLFALTSLVPDEARALLDSLLGRAVPPGARGLIFNGDAMSVLKMFQFASAPAVLRVDPNR